MNLDQTDVIGIPNLTGKPVEEPTDTCGYRLTPIMLLPNPRWIVFHLYSSQYYRLSGQIWDQCFCITLPTYRVVMDAEDQLRKFELDLPASLRYQTTQVAVARPYLSLQVCMSSNLQYDAHGATSSIKYWSCRSTTVERSFW
jgi:hypothetical protein